MRTKIICVLLLIIIICSAILIYKLEQTPEYSSAVYDQVSKEYATIINLYEDKQNNKTQNSQLILSHSSTNNYRTIGVIQIPKINISYPIINECTDENLNIAPAKFLGPAINTQGNLVISGHNNWNKEFFSNLYKLEKGDTVELIDLSGNSLNYKVYDKYEIKQNDFSCLEQDTQGKIELTLLTCVKYQSSKRLVVKCMAN